MEMGTDVDKLLEQVRNQQDQVAKIQRSVESMEIKGSSRGSEVTVTLRGTGRFTDISIDPDALRRYQSRDLGDIVLEAVNDGLRKLSEASSARFKPVIEAASRMEQFDT